MLTRPNCKINLGLYVTGRRPDGYHDLQTIFVPVYDLCDELEIEEASVGGTLLQLEGIALDGSADDNLCMKAYNMLRDEFGLPPVTMRLRKGIPFGAGLGGGSSDAAFVLKMLNEMFALGLDDDGLCRRAARIGADCPFFVINRPCYATGIGDRLEPIDLDLSGYRMVVEIPDGEHVSTREAYGGLRHDLFGKERRDLREVLQCPVGEWREWVVNDFEASVLPMHPAIAELKDDMYRRGALYACMTGSGAAVFGIFQKYKETV